jgi:hypothetical protein
MSRAERIVLWAVLAAILLISLAFRVVDLGRVPGINGDEAWFGVQVQEAIRGGHVEMLTPTGNLLNPFHFGLLYAAHLVHPQPEFWMLRLPAVISGVLLILVAYPIVNHIGGRLAAVFAVAFFACLPVDIAYSRFGWDPSQSALVVMVALGMVFIRRYALALVAILAAVIIHPTNIFAAPIVAGPAVAERLVPLVREWLAHPTSEGRAGRWRRLLWLLPVLVVVLFLVSFLFFRSAATGLLQRLFDVVGWVQFAILYGRLMSGVSVYQFIAGPVSAPATAAYDVVFWLAALPLAGLGTRRWIREGRWRELGLAASTVFSLAALYAVAGLRGILSGRERYALFSVAPSIVLAALWLSGLAVSRLRRKAVAVFAGLVCLALLGDFYLHYFEVFQRTGGSAAHETFWTGAFEPKKAAYDFILKESGDKPILIIAEDWWVYQPIRYLAEGNERVKTRLVLAPSAADAVTDDGSEVFVVGFPSAPPDSPSARGWRVAADFGLRSHHFMTVYEPEEARSTAPPVPNPRSP